MSDTGLDRMTLHSYPEFQTWLARDLEVRNELEALMGAELGLDEPSLDLLEAFLLERFSSPDEITRLAERGVLDAAARHVGLVMLLTIDGAEWAIDLQDEDNVFYRLPVIRFADDGEACPLALVTAALDRRTGSFLRGVVENYIEEYNSEADE